MKLDKTVEIVTDAEDLMIVFRDSQGKARAGWYVCVHEAKRETDAFGEFPPRCKECPEESKSVMVYITRSEP